jgi:exopolyphosphatase / guanosine-5'-triphosphate,3'-diphosphate pyrophosphatase
VTRVAAVDIGTNSTRLLVADVEDGSVRDLDRRLEITRLGEGVDKRRILLPQAIARVRNVLAEYRRAAEQAGAARTLAFATSAVRDAENGEAFLGEVEWSYGFETRLLSGHDEALLTFQGVSAGRPISSATLVIDVGGGSTELVLGGPEGVAFHTSLDLGCVRLTERFGTDFGSAADYVGNVLSGHVPEEVRPSTAIGVAGTITTLATVDLGLAEEDPEVVHGHRLSLESVAAWTERLEGMTVEEIRGLRGMHPDRAPVITAGAVVVRESLSYFGLDGLEVSERDIMHGAALAAAKLPERAEGDAPASAHTCC